jgi:phage terminase large subunit GpA-like protein
MIDTSSANGYVSDTLRSELLRCLRNAQLRPVRSLGQWMAEEFVIPDGKHSGEPFRVETQPISKLLFDEIDSKRWNEIYVTGPSQSGKTLMAFCGPVLYHTLELGEKYVLGIPDMRMANNKWQLDLLPIIQGNPRLQRLLPTSGPGSQGGIVRDTITFKNGGVIKFMSAGGTDQQRAGFTARVVGITEAARFSRTSETSKEADPLRQIRARQASYDEPERQLYVEGTVTVEEDLPWSGRADSTDSKIVCQCVHCGEYVSIEREHLLGWQDSSNAFEAGENARWYCYKCGESIDEEQRREMVAGAKLLHRGQTINRRGEISGPLPPTNRLFFRYSGFHNLFVTTATLAREEWRADQIDHETLEFENAQKELSQFKWCVPYKPSNLEAIPLDGKTILKSRRENFPKGILPPNTTHLTLGCDVGKYSCHYVLLAGLSNGTLHIPDYGIIEVPSSFLDWDVAISQSLNELFDMCHVGWARKGSGELVKPNQVWIDTGYEPDGIFKATIARFGRLKRNSVVQLVLGRGSGQMQRMYEAPPKIGNGVIQIGHHWHLRRNKRWKMFQMFADSDHWKDRVQDSFRHNQSIQEGIVDIPESITIYQAPEREHLRFSKHITNEHRTVEFVPGRGEVIKFERKGANHWLDGTYMARAALDRVGWSAVASEKSDTEQQ